MRWRAALAAALGSEGGLAGVVLFEVGLTGVRLGTTTCSRSRCGSAVAVFLSGCTAGAGGVGGVGLFTGAGGGKAALGFPPPDVREFTVNAGMKVMMGTSSDLLLD